MKKLLVLLGVVLMGLVFSSCEEMASSLRCDCNYVVYTNGMETYRSSWDASCYDEVLDNSVFTNYNGTKTYLVTQIECK